MTTQFFTRQEQARTNTAWLVFLFVAAVLGIVGTTFTIGYFASSSLSVNASSSGALPATNPPDAEVDPWAVGALCGCAAGIVIVLGSLYQIAVLRTGGGTTVAESLGGKPLISETATPEEKRLLNVVEEMAIASGTPVPPVYLLDEPGINAFAAGYRPSDAVVGVTRGALENLNREQLQGVIAHEFSHILNGDMRMNIRMIGILHGILLLSLIGRMLFESLRFMGRGSSNDKGKGGIVLLLVVTGIILMVIGSVGALMGNLIKAAVCRQREFLADASAVQFTRNPEGIAGALKRIAGLAAQGRLRHPNAAVASHLYFAQGVFEGFSGLLATHPPLPKRILAIDPSWDGNLTGSPKKTVSAPRSTGATSAHPAVMGLHGPQAPVAEVPLAVIADAVEHIGAPEVIHQQYSATLIGELPPELRHAVAEPYSARAVIFALLLDRDDSIAKRQLESLRTLMPPAMVQLTLSLVPAASKLPEASRLPLIDLALPMLRRMSASQYEQFRQAFDAHVQADERLTIFEWTLSQVLRRHLSNQFKRASGLKLRAIDRAGDGERISLLLSKLASAGQNPSSFDPQQREASFQHAAQKLPKLTLRLLPPEACSFGALEDALARLRRLSERTRGEILDACAACVAADGMVRIREAELLRGIADLLECPMPPLIAASR